MCVGWRGSEGRGVGMGERVGGGMGEEPPVVAWPNPVTVRPSFPLGIHPLHLDTKVIPRGL